MDTTSTDVPGGTDGRVLFWLGFGAAFGVCVAHALSGDFTARKFPSLRGNRWRAVSSGPRWCKLIKTPEPAHPSRLDRVGTWLSLVEHSLGVRGVGSSNLPVPTIIRISNLRKISPY